ncbi:MAG: OB-fold domain-containing protein, partial [Deltaproteobacteria bacterium]|nr:OB-fold domain-containing protein [Deltaproteobacteria bacterium]
PFVVAVLALEDSGGVRIISNLVEVDPEDVEIGLPVELVWEDMSADLAIPRFRPASKEIRR